MNNEPNKEPTTSGFYYPLHNNMITADGWLSNFAMSGGHHYDNKLKNGRRVVLFKSDSDRFNNPKYILSVSGAKIRVFHNIKEARQAYVDACGPDFTLKCVESPYKLGFFISTIMPLYRS